MRKIGGSIYLTREEWDEFEKKLNTFDPEREARAQKFLSEEPKLDIDGIEKALAAMNKTQDL